MELSQTNFVALRHCKLINHAESYYFVYLLVSISCIAPFSPHYFHRFLVWDQLPFRYGT